MKNLIARINYANAAPFFYGWPIEKFPLTAGFPRQLAQVAREHEIMAGPLPLVECWNLENQFDDLSNWGIAAKDSCESVLLVSSKPISKMDGKIIGITQESSTSVLLLELILREKFQYQPYFKRGLTPDQDGWLLIGDKALKHWHGLKEKDWAHIADLTKEWWEWQGLPFVYARWVVNKSISELIKKDLLHTVESCLESGIKNVNEISLNISDQMEIPKDKIKDYLLKFNYRLGPNELKSIGIFKKMVDKMKKDTRETVQA